MRPGLAALPVKEPRQGALIHPLSHISRWEPRPMPNRRRIPRLHFLPVAILAAVMGLAYLLGDPQRTASPSFAYAKSIAPMHVWGVVFLVGAVAVGSAAFLRDGAALALALFVGGSMFAWWAC